MRNLFIMAVIIFMPILLLAQENNDTLEVKVSNRRLKPKKALKNEIGVSGSMLSAYGLYYQRYISPKNRLQISGFGISLAPFDDRITYANIGLEYHRLVYTYQYNRIFLMLAGGYQLFEKDYASTYSDSKQTTFRAAMGILAERGSHHWKLHLGLGIVYYDRVYENEEAPPNNFGPGLKLGLGYSF